MSESHEFSCPRCGGHNGSRDEADIGVGIQCGPWGCEDCHWTESDTCPICGGTDGCRPGCTFSPGEIL